MGKELEKKATDHPVVIRIQHMEAEIARALPKHMDASRFARIVVTACRRNEKLLQCDPITTIAACLQSAQLGVEPNNGDGRAYLIPYNNRKTQRLECQFQLGYRGMLDLAYKSGLVSSIFAEIIRRNDDFNLELGLDPKIIHKPNFDQDRGAPYIVYAVAVMKDGSKSFAWMTWAEVMSHAKRFSQSFESGPWKSSPEEMAKKTVLKKLSKMLPWSVEIQRAIDSDETTRRAVAEDMTEVPVEEIPAAVLASDAQIQGFIEDLKQDGLELTLGHKEEIEAGIELARMGGIREELEKAKASAKPKAEKKETKADEPKLAADETSF